MRAKICGLNQWQDVQVALDAGADALGFLVGITHLAEDKVTPETARELIRRCPCFVSRVAVTHLQLAKDIVPLVKYIGADTVQLHNDMEPEEIRKVRRELPWAKRIKSVSVQGMEAADSAKSYEGLVDAIILDSRTRERLGGTGLTHDWNISRAIVDSVNMPVILAGGLNPKNVRDAINTVHPFAIDVNSGVETAGRKDPEKVKAFVNTAHEWKFPHKVR